MLKCVAHTQTQTHTCAKIKRNPVEQIVLRHLQNYAMQSTSTACSPLLSYTPLHCPRRSYTPHHFALSPSAQCAAHVTFASQQQQPTTNSFQFSFKYFTISALFHASKSASAAAAQTADKQEQAKYNNNNNNMQSIRNATAECVGPRDNVLFMYKANLLLLFKQ